MKLQVGNHSTYFSLRALPPSSECEYPSTYTLSPGWLSDGGLSGMTSRSPFKLNKIKDLSEIYSLSDTTIFIFWDTSI